MIPAPAWFIGNAAANEDIRNFVFATATLSKSMRNCLDRKGGLQLETTLARDRTIGGHATSPRIALRQLQFLGHSGAGSEEHLVRRLPSQRRMRIFVLCSLT
jgi:hypothetical protein